MMPKPLTLEQIKLMEKAGQITANAITEVSKYIKPNISTLELSEIANDYIKSHGASPTFYQYNGFPGYICISIDDVVVHGIPSDRKLKEGEIISIDCGATYQGYVGDSAYTFPVGKISKEKELLLKITEESLYKGIAQAKNKGKVYDIARAIQEYVEANGYSLTRELTGHGVGKYLHQSPSIPNFVPPLIQRRNLPNEKLYTGLSIAIEPMVHTGKKDIYIANDQWAVITRDHSPAAHFEHTIIIQDGEPIITTLRN